MQDFRKLKVWERAHDLTLGVYRVSAVFPHEERFGLTSQVRRSTSSIAANIAEGCGRGGRAEFARFLQIAMGSASETEYHLLLAKDLDYLTPDDYVTLSGKVEEVKRMLTALLAKLH